MLLAACLRAARYDRVVLFHHLTTTRGTMRFRALAAATRSPIVVGLDNGRGRFLTKRVIDRGFGMRHEAEYMLAVAVASGGAIVDARPRLEAPSGLASPAALPDEFVALAPVSGPYSRAREWPIERFVKLASRIASVRRSIVVVGGDDATEAGRAIREGVGDASVVDLSGRTSIAQLALVLSRASLMIGNDSFPAHLAAAVGTPTLTIFGPSNLRAWAPYGSSQGCDPARRAIVVSANLPCSPCLYTGYELGRREGCPQRTCLTTIGVDEVYGAAMELLGA
jgi:heptosyltransferase-2